MADSGIPRLCGGTVFTLILEARPQRYGVREHFRGDSDGLSEMETLIGLAQVMVPGWTKPPASRTDTAQGNTTEFKICKTAGGKAHFPFSNAQHKKAFNARVLNNYNQALEAMKGFVSTFIFNGNGEGSDGELVKALLDLIDKDATITNDQLFYVCSDGQPLSKAKIAQMTDICIESFLLGVWHFALLRPEGNTIGKDTIDRWCPSRGGGARKYEGNMGEAFNRKINVTYLEREQADVTTDMHEDFERTEAEIVDSDDWETVEDDPQLSNSDPSGSTKNFYNNSNVFNINISGNNNNVIAHADKVYANKE